MDELEQEMESTDQPVDTVDVVDGDDLADVPLVPERFAVVDAASASWVIRKVNEARLHAKRVQAWAEVEVRRAKRDEEHLLLRFGGPLQEFATRQIAKLKGRRRSINLPGGRVGFRQVGPTLVVDDPDALLAWAKARCAEAVVVKESFSKSAVNRHVEATGELPDGAHLQAGEDRFYIA